MSETMKGYGGVPVRVLPPGVSGADLAAAAGKQVLSEEGSMAKTIKCSKCGEPGHNARGCRKNIAGAGVAAKTSTKPQKNRGGRTNSLSETIAELKAKVANYQAAIKVLEGLGL